MITSFGAISADQSDADGRLLALSEPGNPPNESPGTMTRRSMFGAPLVLHGQDQDGKFPFIGSFFFSR
jgi:hypothetical protein